MAKIFCTPTTYAVNIHSVSAPDLTVDVLRDFVNACDVHNMPGDLAVKVAKFNGLCRLEARQIVTESPGWESEVNPQGAGE
jgi:hypothetical protein